MRKLPICCLHLAQKHSKHLPMFYEVILKPLKLIASVVDAENT